MSIKIDDLYYPCKIKSELYHIHAEVLTEYTDAPEEKQVVYVDIYHILSDDEGSKENLLDLVPKEVLLEMEELGDEIVTRMFLEE